MTASISEFFNVRQAARFIGVNPDTIRRWAQQGKFIGHKVGTRGDWRFTKEELSKLVKTNHNNTYKSEQPKSFPIVGIGASAGGLEAASQFLKALPIDTGMGFVLVQHLDPTHESILANLLSKTTTLSVKEAEDNSRVLPNHVYVIPHDKDMCIKNGVLELIPRTKKDKIHMPIDQFFIALSESHKENAIGVILSGTGSDGTLGFKAIKNNGGITFAQDATAKYQGMPKAAFASGNVDLVLSPAGIVEELMKKNHRSVKEHSKSPEASEESTDGLSKIFSLLNKNQGIDFRHYKTATMNRRIARRMRLRRITNIEDYNEYLKENSQEVESLNADLLINVTSFFREAATTKFLKDKIFPRVIANKGPKDPIRIWVPGCATGEEAYSVAIAVTEFLEEKSIHNPIQIFGTDVSRNIIEKARKGIYTKKDVANILPGRLERFFEKKEDMFQINKTIRELCVFAPHNVFSDPPFSRLDLISCCNLMIYLDQKLQDRILHAFHFSLKPEGFLILGKSEAVGAAPELFSQIDKKYKIFMKKRITAGRVPHFGNIVPTLDKKDISSSPPIHEERENFDIQKEAESVLLSHYTPASVVINNDLDILQFRGSTGTFLEPSPGKASFNLIKMAREGLGFELRSAISKVRKSGKSFKKEGIPLQQNGTKQEIAIEVLPLNDPLGDTYFLVMFEDSKKSNGHNTQIVSGKRSGNAFKPGTKDHEIVELQKELTQTREDMRSITEEQEATNEELQTASEEILSSNEELQSINEELETSKEELESTNEELTTVNEELQHTNEQLTEARDYAEAIIRTVQVPLLILDQDLRVLTANRSFNQMFKVPEGETAGKLVYDLGNGQWNIPALRKLLNEILPQNNVFNNYEIEHTFPSIGQRIMLLNARKFYKDGDHILLAIEDITDRKNIDKQKDLFIGIASHELKTPITTMKGYAQILEKLLLKKGDSKSIYLVQNVSKQAERMTDLINDLLNTSKIQAGKLVLEKKKFDLNATLAKIVVDFQYATESHQIVKVGEIQEIVYGDQGRIEQVISNLITNAIKYSPKADKVIVGIKKENKNAKISIQDFGFGISKKDQKKVFERFYRTGYKEEMGVSGFGLGLYISSEIIKSHKGKIWIESIKGKGTTILFTLPL